MINSLLPFCRPHTQRQRKTFYLFIYFFFPFKKLSNFIYQKSMMPFNHFGFVFKFCTMNFHLSKNATGEIYRVLFNQRWMNVSHLLLYLSFTNNKTIEIDRKFHSLFSHLRLIFFFFFQFEVRK